MEDLYHDIAGEVFALLKRLKTGEWEPKSATHAVRELRSFLEFVLDERMKVAKLSKQEAGAVCTGAPDQLAHPKMKAVEGMVMFRHTGALT